MPVKNWVFSEPTNHRIIFTKRSSILKQKVNAGMSGRHSVLLEQEAGVPTTPGAARCCTKPYGLHGELPQDRFTGD